MLLAPCTTMKGKNQLFIWRIFNCWFWLTNPYIKYQTYLEPIQGFLTVNNLHLKLFFSSKCCVRKKNLHFCIYSQCSRNCTEKYRKRNDGSKLMESQETKTSLKKNKWNDGSPRRWWEKANFYKVQYQAMVFSLFACRSQKKHSHLWELPSQP